MIHPHATPRSRPDDRCFPDGAPDRRGGRIRLRVMPGAKASSFHGGRHPGNGQASAPSGRAGHSRVHNHSQGKGHRVPQPSFISAITPWGRHARTSVRRRRTEKEVGFATARTVSGSPHQTLAKPGVRRGSPGSGWGALPVTPCVLQPGTGTAKAPAPPVPPGHGQGDPPSPAQRRTAASQRGHPSDPLPRH